MGVTRAKRRSPRWRGRNDSPRWGRGRWPGSAPRRRGRKGVFCAAQQEAKQKLQLPPIDESSSSQQEFLIQPEKSRGLSRPSPQKESPGDSCASGSVNSDGVSEMVLPSGVSTFFLACMDSDSPGAPSLSLVSESSLSSPEVFRKADDLGGTAELTAGDDDPWGGCRNSTLLDTSRAVAINMRQPPNASEILELSAGRETGHSDNRSSVLPTAAATVSGKRVSKLRRHRDGALQSQNRAALPSLPRKKVSFEESVSWKMPGSAAEAHKAQTTARTEGPDVDRQAKPALAPQKRELRPEPVPERGSGRSRRRDRGGDAKRGRKGKVAGKPVGSREESGRPPLPSARLSPGPPENHPRSSRRRAAAPPLCFSESRRAFCLCAEETQADSSSLHEGALSGGGGSGVLDLTGSGSDRVPGTAGSRGSGRRVRASSGRGLRCVPRVPGPAQPPTRHVLFPPQTREAPSWKERPVKIRPVKWKGEM
ncbi:uncharacterized protein [Lepisosteus oculatus]|uniref:uncharacterized protein isoform X1 n=1 Tax=Lepisosteus oculatus TaxID=7918 RepID=UPI0035F51FFE